MNNITAIAFDLEGTLLEMLSEENAANNLKLLKKSYKLGIGSNGGEDLLRRVDQAGISHLFGVNFLAPVMGVSKPDPQFFIQLAGWMNTTVENVLFVGDSIHYDIDGANSANMPCCLFSPYETSHQGMAIRSLEDLINQLQTKNA